mgnify:CR=1 FL=1
MNELDSFGRKLSARDVARFQSAIFKSTTELNKDGCSWLNVKYESCRHKQERDDSVVIQFVNYPMIQWCRTNYLFRFASLSFFKDSSALFSTSSMRFTASPSPASLCRCSLLLHSATPASPHATVSRIQNPAALIPILVGDM